jgi:hypothetical protein
MINLVFSSPVRTVPGVQGTWLMTEEGILHSQTMLITKVQHPISIGCGALAHCKMTHTPS